MNHKRRFQICDELGFEVTSDLDRYLGVPLFRNSVSNSHFRHIIDKVDKRLASWKTNFLNTVGRYVLINYVINAFPTYTIQTARLPISICNSILHHKNIVACNTCNFCGDVNDLIHCVRDCNCAKNLWMPLVNPLLWDTFFSLNMQDWII